MMAGPRQAKTGGRKPGVPNVVATARVERAVAAGRKMPPDELLRNAENCRAMAARFGPKRINEKTKKREDNPGYSPKDYHDWLAAERAALTAAAPYYAPRLTAIAMQTSQLDRDKEARADPRVALLELLMQMRERDDIGRKALPAPGNGRGEIIDAVVAEVVEDDDNGDGEAA
jgi:hypothetical protein